MIQITWWEGREKALTGTTPVASMIPWMYSTVKLDTPMFLTYSKLVHQVPIFSC